MKYGRTAGIGCGVVLGLGLASGASAQVTPVVAGASITAAGINAIIDAVNGVVTSVDGNLSLPATTLTTGQVLVNGTLFLHSFGTRNTFLGLHAGNFTLTGVDNTAVGHRALSDNITGSKNTRSAKARSRPTSRGLATRRSAKTRSTPTPRPATTRRSVGGRSWPTSGGGQHGGRRGRAP